ncbi:hypothetical protein ACIBF5_09710 [Micromonospora sp. NPDC050417]|uniref:hypothetical protein n=1 Tax=Micromonospora sp. NPDC050417 TaxID=3364280 RepID=UPI0037A8EF4D
MATILDHPFMRLLLSLDLPREDCAVAGSGPLFARGWITDPGDIDVVARGAAWEIATKHGRPAPAPQCDVQLISLFDGSIEVLDGWFCEDRDALIDSADVIEGVRFVTLDVVARTKSHLNRPRDVEHLKVMHARGWDWPI